MTEGTLNVLFLCTGNSARSIIAEAVMNDLGMGRFRACSAGSHPKGQVHPHAMRLLNGLGYDTAGLRSKSWSEYAGNTAPKFDFVFTVCDCAATEACPVWPGHPLTAHWGVPDPAEAQGSDVQVATAFHDAYTLLRQRIDAFLKLPIASLDDAELRRRLADIGAMRAVAPAPTRRRSRA